MEAGQTPASNKTESNTKSVRMLWIGWVIHICFLFLSDVPPGESLLHLRPQTLQEAIALSLNFWFVLPALVPKVAPVLTPALEGLFNIAVTWG